MKGRAAVGEIALSDNEYRTAERLKKDYWLYVVFNCGTTPELHLIQDPCALGWQPVVQVAHYHVGPDAILKGRDTMSSAESLPEAPHRGGPSDQADLGPRAPREVDPARAHLDASHLVGTPATRRMPGRHTRRTLAGSSGSRTVQKNFVAKPRRK